MYYSIPISFVWNIFWAIALFLAYRYINYANMYIKSILHNMYQYDFPENISNNPVGFEPRGRCYDFKNIFAENFGTNIGVFCSNHC
jgi:hypothetical protein